MPQNTDGLVSSTSLALISPILAALRAEQDAVLKPVGSMPAPCFQLARLRTVICATSIDALPVYRNAMVTLAAIRRVDVLLVRHGSHPEIIDAVNIDIVTGREQPMHLLWSMCAFRGVDGSYWLVPPEGDRGPSLYLGEAGLMVTPRRPYRDMFERSDGVSRAARETVLALRRLRRP